MKRIIVRYKVKDGRADENEAFIKKVFEELQANAPDGLRYAAFKGEDGLSFFHIVSIETEDGENPLSESPAFKAFQAGIRDRCQEPPMPVELTEVGSYNFFGD